MVCELAKQLWISIVVCGGFANFPILGTGELAKPNLRIDGALCQLTRRRMFALVKQLRISMVVSGGFANFPILGTGELAKPILRISVRFAKWGMRDHPSPSAAVRSLPASR